jgi:hypothetical protein
MNRAKQLIEQVMNGVDPVSAIYESGKVVVKELHPADKETRVAKYEITGRKGDQYKKATWDWLLKSIPREDWPKYGLEVKVLVWQTDGKAAHDQYGQVFTPDKPSVRSAIKYAKKLIEDGIANMAEVVGNFHGYDPLRGGRRTMQAMSFGIWEKAV